MGIAKWSDFDSGIAVFKTFEEIKFVESKAAAVAEFLKKDKAALDMQNKVGRYRVEIEATKGKWLDENYPHGVNLKYRNSGVTQMETPEFTDENSESITIENADLEIEMPVSPKESSNARLINNEPDLREKVIHDIIQNGKVITPRLVSTGIRKIVKGATLRDKKEEFIKQSKAEIFILPEVCLMECNDFLQTFDDDSIDLLFTDPPYMTDVPDIGVFTESWLPLAILKTKKSGRMLIFSGAYPMEIQAFLNVLLSQDKFIVAPPLIWTFKNTLGVTPSMHHNLNYQFIWELYSKQSSPLDNSITNEMFTVMEENAPDGRQGNRLHTWQKPDDLALRLIRHTTKINDLIVDPFTCTGTFILAANRLNRVGKGCDNNQENLNIAITRGCMLINKKDETQTTGD